MFLPFFLKKKPRQVNINSEKFNSFFFSSFSSFYLNFSSLHLDFFVMATNKKLNKITVLNQSKKSSDLPVQQNVS